MKPHRIYKFDSFCLDATAKVLLKDGQTVAMTRKAVETLLALVENSGQVVPKEELLSIIWPDRVVDEANLTQNIAMVRRALAAERGTPAYIETFPGRGYRLLGPVAIESPSGQEPPLTEPAIETVAPSEGQPKTSVEEHLQMEKPVPVLSHGFFPGGAILTSIVLLVVTAAAGWFYQQRNVSSSEAMFRVSPFTRLPGKELQPALSPDGRKVAFLWDQGNGQRPDIRVQTSGENSSVQITREEGHYSSPAWSPSTSRPAAAASATASRSSRSASRR